MKLPWVVGVKARDFGMQEPDGVVGTMVTDESVMIGGNGEVNRAGVE